MSKRDDDSKFRQEVARKSAMVTEQVANLKKRQALQNINAKNNSANTSVVEEPPLDVSKSPVKDIIEDDSPKVNLNPLVDSMAESMDSSFGEYSLGTIHNIITANIQQYNMNIMLQERKQRLSEEPIVEKDEHNTSDEQESEVNTSINTKTNNLLGIAMEDDEIDEPEEPRTSLPPTEESLFTSATVFPDKMPTNYSIELLNAQMDRIFQRNQMLAEALLLDDKNKEDIESTPNLAASIEDPTPIIENAVDDIEEQVEESLVEELVEEVVHNYYADTSNTNNDNKDSNETVDDNVEDVVEPQIALEEVNDSNAPIAEETVEDQFTLEVNLAPLIDEHGDNNEAIEAIADTNNDVVEEVVLPQPTIIDEAEFEAALGLLDKANEQTLEVIRTSIEGESLYLRLSSNEVSTSVDVDAVNDVVEEDEAVSALDSLAGRPFTQSPSPTTEPDNVDVNDEPERDSIAYPAKSTINDYHAYLTQNSDKSNEGVSFLTLARRSFERQEMLAAAAAQKGEEVIEEVPIVQLGAEPDEIESPNLPPVNVDTLEDSIKYLPSSDITSNLPQALDPLSQSLMSEVLKSVNEENMNDYIARAYQAIRNKAVLSHHQQEYDNNNPLYSSVMSLPPPPTNFEESLPQPINNVNTECKEEVHSSAVVDPLEHSLPPAPPSVHQSTSVPPEPAVASEFTPYEIGKHMSTALMSDLLKTADEENMDDYIARAYQAIKDKAVIDPRVANDDSDPLSNTAEILAATHIDAPEHQDNDPLSKSLVEFINQRDEEEQAPVVETAASRPSTSASRAGHSVDPSPKADINSLLNDIAESLKEDITASPSYFDYPSPSKYSDYSPHDDVQISTSQFEIKKVEPTPYLPPKSSHTIDSAPQPKSSPAKDTVSNEVRNYLSEKTEQMFQQLDAKISYFQPSPRSDYGSTVSSNTENDAEKEALRTQLKSTRILIDYKYFLEATKMNKRRIAMGHEILLMIQQHNEEKQKQQQLPQQKIIPARPLSIDERKSQIESFSDDGQEDSPSDNEEEEVKPVDPAEYHGRFIPGHHPSDSRGFQSILTGEDSHTPILRSQSTKSPHNNVTYQHQQQFDVHAMLPTPPSAYPQVSPMMAPAMQSQQPSPYYYQKASPVSPHRAKYVEHEAAASQLIKNTKWELEKNEQNQHFHLPHGVYHAPIHPHQPPPPQYPQPGQRTVPTPVDQIIVIPVTSNPTSQPPVLRSQSANRNRRAPDLPSVPEDSNIIEIEPESRKDRIRSLSAGRGGGVTSIVNGASKHTNYPQTKNAITCVCLAGSHFEQKRNEVIELLDYYSSASVSSRGVRGSHAIDHLIEHERLKNSVNHFILMFYKTNVQALKGIYAIDPSTDAILRIYGGGPKELPSASGPNVAGVIIGFMKYETSTKSFKELPVRTMSSAVDAVIIVPGKIKPSRNSL